MKSKVNLGAIDTTNEKRWRMIKADDRNTGFIDRQGSMNESIHGSKEDN